MFKQKRSNVRQLPTNKLPLTLASYLVLDMIGDQCNGKCTTQCLTWILGDQFDDMGRKIGAFPPHTHKKSGTEFTVPAIYSVSQKKSPP